MDSELLRLSDLLTAAAPASAAPGPATPGFGTARRPARPSSAATAAAAEPGLPSPTTAHEQGVQLHSSLAKELSTLDALFAHWQAGELDRARLQAAGWRRWRVNQRQQQVQCSAYWLMHWIALIDSCRQQFGMQARCTPLH